MTMLEGVFTKEVIERCVQQSHPWSTKARRVRASTALALVLFVMAMALWSRLNQCQVWQKLVGKLSDLHPGSPQDGLSDSGISGRRQALGSQGLQAVMRERCQLIAQPESMPSAFFGRYRLMAIDGTVFNTPDTPANATAFGRSSNQYGPGASPQAGLCSTCASWERMHWGHWKQGRGKTCPSNDAWVMARCWRGFPRPARSSILCSRACGCASSPIASPMSAWEKRARCIAW